VHLGYASSIRTRTIEAFRTALWFYLSPPEKETESCFDIESCEGAREFSELRSVLQEAKKSSQSLHYFCDESL